MVKVRGVSTTLTKFVVYLFRRVVHISQDVTILILMQKTKKKKRKEESYTAVSSLYLNKKNKKKQNYRVIFLSFINGVLL